MKMILAHNLIKSECALMHNMELVREYIDIINDRNKTIKSNNRFKLYVRRIPSIQVVKQSFTACCSAFQEAYSNKRFPLASRL